MSIPKINKKREVLADTVTSLFATLTPGGRPSQIAKLFAEPNSQPYL